MLTRDTMLEMGSKIPGELGNKWRKLRELEKQKVEVTDQMTKGLEQLQRAWIAGENTDSLRADQIRLYTLAIDIVLEITKIDMENINDR